MTWALFQKELQSTLTLICQAMVLLKSNFRSILTLYETGPGPLPQLPGQHAAFLQKSLHKSATSPVYAVLCPWVTKCHSAQGTFMYMCTACSLH